MNLPNQLTMLRLVLTLIFVAVTACDIQWAYTAGLLLFIAASITDWLDGSIARKRNLVTTFGKLMDPLADKILMCAIFIVLVAERLIPAWVVVLILSREFLVTGLRLVASSQGSIMAADSMGKLKTILQISMAIYFLLYLASRETSGEIMAPLFDISLLSPEVLGRLLVYSALLVTIVSGWRYWRSNRSLLRDM